MSINEVIDLGKNVPSFSFDTLLTPLIIIAIAAWVIISIFLFFYFEGTFVGMYLILVFAFLLFNLISFEVDSTLTDKKSEHMKNWKENVVYDFIEELPKKEEVELIQFVEKSPMNEINSDNLFDSLTTSQQYFESAKYGELTYSVDGKENTEYGWFIMNIIPAGDPSYSYKEVQKDLGHEIKKGLYNKTITIPSDEYHLEGTTILYFK